MSCLCLSAGVVLQETDISACMSDTFHSAAKHTAPSRRKNLCFPSEIVLAMSWQ